MFKNESERWLWKTGDDTKRRGSIGQSNGANRVLSMNTPPQDRLFTKYHPEKNWQNYNEQTGKRCLPSHLSNWTHSMGQTILYLHPHDGNADAIWWDLKEEATNPFQKITKFSPEPTFSSLADALLLAVIFVTVPFLVNIFVPILMIISKVILLPIPISMMIGQFDWLAIQC